MSQRRRPSELPLRDAAAEHSPLASHMECRARMPLAQAVRYKHRQAQTENTTDTS